MRTDLYNISLDCTKRFYQWGSDTQFIVLAVVSLLCSLIYGILLDGWINQDALDSPKILAQSENLFALVAAVVHSLCAAGERQFHNSVVRMPSSIDATSMSMGGSSSSSSESSGASSSLSSTSVVSAQMVSIWTHHASLRSYVIYSSLEAAGFLCLNWSLIFLDKHICAIFKSTKILMVLIGEVFLLKREMTGYDVASIIAVAVSMMLLTLNELDEVNRFNLSGIPLVCVGILCAAAAPVLAKRYIFAMYHPPRTEVMFFHNFFTAFFLFIAVVPQVIFLWSSHWFEQHMLGFAEMIILSVVSYVSHSLILMVIHLFGPTNSELLECTSMVTSILFSYYFIASGTEFVFVHFLALAGFFGAFFLNVYGMSQQQRDQLRNRNEQMVRHCELTQKELEKGVSEGSGSPRPDSMESEPFITPFRGGSTLYSRTGGDKSTVELA